VQGLARLLIRKSILRAGLAAAATVFVPVALLGAAEPDTKAEYSTKKVCEVSVPTGSRLGGVRRCRTAAEREEAKAEDRDVVDRIQSRKAFSEGMTIGACRGNSRAC